MLKTRKVVIVGAGHVGSHVALALIQSGEADDIVLIDILKEKASGIHKMNYKTMYLCTLKYVKAWVMVYPCMFVPSFICSKLMKKYRKRLRIKDDIRINRPE